MSDQKQKIEGNTTPENSEGESMPESSFNVEMSSPTQTKSSQSASFFSKYKKYIIIACVLIVILILFLVLREYSVPLIKQMLRSLSDFTASKSILCFTFYSIIESIFSCIILPGAVYVDIAIAYFMKDFWAAFLLLFLSSYISSQAVFLLARYFFREKLKRRFRKNKLMTAIQEEVRINPWKACILLNVVFIPMALKNLIFPLTEMTYLQFAIPSMPFIAFYDALLVFVGMELTSFEQIFQPAEWKKMTQGQKIEVIAGWVASLLSFVVVALVGWRIKRRLKLMEEPKFKEKIEHFSDNQSTVTL